MKKTWLGLVAAVLLLMPIQAGAGEHGAGHEMQEMDHQGMAHGGMEMGGDMTMLPGDEQDGVKAMVHLNDVHEAMGKMGMAETHHFMVMFTDIASGKQLEHGVAAIKIIDPDGNASKAKKLMAMDGSFGADIALPEKGHYTFEVGTRLDDGKQRQFSFHYTVE